MNNNRHELKKCSFVPETNVVATIVEVIDAKIDVNDESTTRLFFPLFDVSISYNSDRSSSRRKLRLKKSSIRSFSEILF